LVAMGVQRLIQTRVSNQRFAVDLLGACDTSR
jgi:hypothetical protein